MESWVQDAIAQWEKEGLRINTGANLADIEKVEKQIGFKFPDDFKELYLEVNGFVDFESRSFLLSLWSLSRISREYAIENKIIAFADHSISVCEYGFYIQNEGIFKAYDFQQAGVEPNPIAKNFQEMISLFNNDSELLY